MRGLRHLAARKHPDRHEPISVGLEPFPATSAWKRVLDRLVFVVGVIGPLTTVPQILEIYVLHEARGVSAISWGLPALLNIPWIIYGFVHRDRPIVVTYILWLIMNTTIFIGAIIYGANL